MGFVFVQSTKIDTKNKSTVSLTFNYTIGNNKCSKKSVAPVMRATKEEWDTMPADSKEELMYDCLNKNKDKLQVIFRDYVDGKLHQDMSLEGLDKDIQLKIQLKRVEKIKKALAKLDINRFDYSSLLPSSV